MHMPCRVGRRVDRSSCRVVRVVRRALLRCSETKAYKRTLRSAVQHRHVNTYVRELTTRYKARYGAIDGRAVPRPPRRIDRPAAGPQNARTNVASRLGERAYRPEAVGHRPKRRIAARLAARHAGLGDRPLASTPAMRPYRTARTMHRTPSTNRVRRAVDTIARAS